MGLGKSKSTSRSQSQTDPFGPAKGNINSILAQARGLEGERALAPIDPLRLEAGQQLEDIARSGVNITDPSLGFASGILGGAGGAGVDALTQSASGQFLPGQGGNNLLDQVIGNRQQSTADLIRRQAASAGRGGSPAETGILARELGKIGLEGTLDQFQRERLNQLQSARSLIGGGQNVIGNISGLTQAAGFSPDLLARAGDIRQEGVQRELDDPFASIQRQSDLALPIATNFASRSGSSQGTQQKSILDQIAQGVKIGTSVFGTGAGGGLFGR